MVSSQKRTRKQAKRVLGNCDRCNKATEPDGKGDWVHVSNGLYRCEFDKQYVGITRYA